MWGSRDVSPGLSGSGLLAFEWFPTLRSGQDWSSGSEACIESLLYGPYVANACTVHDGEEIGVTPVPST
jgi:hypothetical protein